MTDRCSGIVLTPVNREQGGGGVPGVLVTTQRVMQASAAPLAYSCMMLQCSITVCPSGRVERKGKRLTRGGGRKM